MREARAKRILNVHRRRDPWFLDRYSVNPYYGCPFNCLYCYTRGSRYSSRQGLAVKVNAPALLSRELRKIVGEGVRGYVAVSTSTEAWNMYEEHYGVTRRVLEVLSEYRVPVHVLTKSPLVLRDADILRRIDGEARLPPDLRETPGRGVLITFSFSTLRSSLARILEPGAPPPGRRVEAAGKLLREGFMVGMAFMPVLPHITDGELEEMARTASRVGARYVFFSPLTLYGEGKDLFLYLVKKRFGEAYASYVGMYAGRSFPPRQYTGLFYRKVRELSEKYGLKIGVTGE